MSEKATSTQSSSVTAGSLVGRYRIESELGSGGMSDVFYALHEDLRRPAAIKVLKASLAADETNLQRFLNEARSAASLVHPNIVQVYDVGSDGPLKYIAQEFVPGVNLRQYLAKCENGDAASSEAAATLTDGSEEDRQLDLSVTLSILLQVLAALDKSSSRGIVHRDIKPENILLTTNGEAKVADFGLARTFLGDDPKLTKAGTTMGTPMYMSPEQIEGNQVDVRSDLYSLGVTLFHMLAGRPPFLGETQLALAMQHTQTEAPRVDEFRTELPNSMIGLVDRLLRKSPEERFESPREVLDYLTQHRSSDLNSSWPDQTVPLPRAAAIGNRAGMAQTQALQALLQKPTKPIPGLKWIKRIAAGLVMLALFAFAAWLTFYDGIPDNRDPTIYNGIKKLATARDQYFYALVNEKSGPASALDTWRAVRHFFGQGEDENSRQYVWQAEIQLARALNRAGDKDEAIDELSRMIENPRLEGEFDNLRAHAYVVRALMEDEKPKAEQNSDKIREDIDAALQIIRNTDGERKQVLIGQLDPLMQTATSTTALQRWANGLDSDP